MMPASKKELLKRAAIAVSVANLCFLYVWSEILHVATERRFFLMLGARPDRLFLWALLLDVVVLGAVLFGILSLRRSRPRLLRVTATIILAVACLFALYQGQRSLNAALYGVMSTREILLLRIVVAALILFLIVRRPRRALPGVRTLFLVLSPLVLVFTAHGFLAYYGSGSRMPSPPQVAGFLPANAPHRVIWIIFDELDYRLLFTARPSRIQLPHFDALRHTAIFADYVKSPAHDTLAAVPSLLLGKIIPLDKDVNLNTRPVQVRFSGCKQFVSLPAQQNIFRSVRDLGFDGAVSGWYHAYCRLFGRDMSACATTAGADMAVVIPQQLLRDRPFLQKAAYLANWQARALPLQDRLHWVSEMPEEARYARQMHIIKNKTVMQRGAQMLRNHKLDFVFLHLPIPHPPGIWNTHTQSFSTDSQLNYIDNLELADRRLGEIRKILEQNGDWDSSTILVSSDHPYRPKNWLSGPVTPGLAEMVRATNRTWQPYIPFFLKMPGQKTGIDYQREFNSVLSANLLLAVLEGDVHTTSQAVKWLNANAAASESRVCPITMSDSTAEP